MMNLADVPLNQVMQIETIDLGNELKRRMQDLGMFAGAKVAVVSHSGKNHILLLHSTRVAVDQAIVKKIFVKDATNEVASWTSLDQLAVGEYGVIVNVHGSGAIRRRLMDMGLTKGTAVKVMKLAPLGDPMEIRLRGYGLSLRKKESEMIIVTKEERL